MDESAVLPVEKAAREADLHLRFDLNSQPGLAFAAASVVEVVELNTSQVTTVPNASPTLVGTFNLRGEILWVLDLEYCLYRRLFRGSGTSFPVVVIRDGDYLLGLAVQTIQGMTWLDKYQVEAVRPETIPPALAPLVRGHSPAANLLILDAAAVFRARYWA